MAISKRICALAVLAIIAATLMTAGCRSPKPARSARLMLRSDRQTRVHAVRHQPGAEDSQTLRNAGRTPGHVTGHLYQVFVNMRWASSSYLLRHLGFQSRQP